MDINTENHKHREPRIRNSGVLIPKWAVGITPLPHRAQGALRKRRHKDCNSQGSRRMATKQCLLDMTGSCTHKLSAAVGVTVDLLKSHLVLSSIWGRVILTRPCS